MRYADVLSKFHGNSGVRRFLTVLRGNRFTGLEYGHLGLGRTVEETYFLYVCWNTCTRIYTRKYIRIVLQLFRFRILFPVLEQGFLVKSDIGQLERNCKPRFKRRTWLLLLFARFFPFWFNFFKTIIFPRHYSSISYPSGYIFQIILSNMLFVLPKII